VTPDIFKTAHGTQLHDSKLYMYTVKNIVVLTALDNSSLILQK